MVEGGILEDEIVTVSDKGTAQGSVASPDRQLAPLRFLEASIDDAERLTAHAAIGGRSLLGSGLAPIVGDRFAGIHDLTG